MEEQTVKMVNEAYETLNVQMCAEKGWPDALAQMGMWHSLFPRHGIREFLAKLWRRR